MARRPKKSHVERVETDLGTFDVQVRIDVSSGEFSAEHDGIEYRADTVKEMRAKLRESLREIAAVEYKPYLAVDDDNHWSGHREGRGVRLRFEAMLLSDPIPSRNGRRLRKQLKFDSVTGEIEGEYANAPYPWTGTATLIPYTPERYRMLRRIEAAIRETRERLRELLHDGTGDEVGERLDAGVIPLLPAKGGLLK